jgi:hypothetical protein
LSKIEVIVPARPRVWQKLLVERLAEAGHDLAIVRSSHDAAAGAAMSLVLALERKLLRRPAGLFAPAGIAARLSIDPIDLRLDLAGEAIAATATTMQIAFDGTLADTAALTALAAGREPDIDILLGGHAYDHAAPMVDNRIFVAAGIEDVLARAVTLTLRAVARFSRGERTAIPYVANAHAPAFAATYLASSVPRIAREIIRRSRYRFAHWRVGYRLTDGPGVAETGALGTGWAVLPDDGSRFYADPFPFEHDGRRYIFVEDYPHATRKAVISVAELDAHGVAGKPRPVLEEPHHLSYPQVFAHDGQIWMLPEGSGSARLTLYRAEDFPNRWVPAATLLEGEISDATLLHRADGFWLFATDRDGGGSTSDTLVVFHAPALTGPWTPHRQNPILIDRRRARPGGAVIASGSQLALPVQDGTLGYGGGLGLSTILRLDAETVELGDPRPVSGAGDFPYPQIHTLNRAGRLEVIDGIAAVRKR